MNNHNQEVEVRFLEIQKDELVARLKSIGAQDLGEVMLEEVIFYDKDMRWRDQEHKLVRLRKSGDRVMLTYKHHHSKETADGTEEIEFLVGNMQPAEDFLTKIGLVAFRHQQKLRHSFKLGEVVFDIDTWPRIPTYVEIEAADEAALKQASVQAGLDWKNVVYEDARSVIENKYKIPVGQMRWFTFDKFE
jgi:adenylate cyclase, class 2